VGISTEAEIVKAGEAAIAHLPTNFMGKGGEGERKDKRERKAIWGRKGGWAQSRAKQLPVENPK